MITEQRLFTHIKNSSPHDWGVLQLSDRIAQGDATIGWDDNYSALWVMKTNILNPPTKVDYPGKGLKKYLKEVHGWALLETVLDDWGKTKDRGLLELAGAIRRQKVRVAFIGPHLPIVIPWGK